MPSETLPLCLSFVRWLGCFARSSVCGRGEGGRHGTRDWWRCFRQAGLLVRHRKSIHSLGAGIGLQFSQRGLIEAKIEERLRRVESSSRRSRSSRLGRQRIGFTLSPGRNWRLLVRALGRDAGIPGSIEVGRMWRLGGTSPPVSPPRWGRGRGLVPFYVGTCGCYIPPVPLS